MTLKKKPAKAVKPKKSAPKKSKKRTPVVMPVGLKGKGKTYKSDFPNLSGKKNLVKMPPPTYCGFDENGKLVESRTLEGLKKRMSNKSVKYTWNTLSEKLIPKESSTDQIVRELKMRVTALEHELENKLPTDHGYDYPIDITVLNVTDKTLENVPLFNDKYRDQQDVVYSSYFLEGYSDVIKFKNAIGVGARDKEIGMIRVMSESKMLSSAIIATAKSMDGVSTQITLFMVIDPIQNQSCILQRNQRLRYNVGTNLLIKSLPPMTKFTYSIYFISEDYKKRMEALKQKVNSQP